MIGGSDAGAPGAPDAPGGAVVWLSGLPASGKSSLARAVAARAAEGGRRFVVLDGDAVRAVLRPAPGYDEAGRDAFYETLAGLAALVARGGHVVLVPATAHLARYRALARSLAPRFVEVFVDTPLATCVARDPKGLYARARAEGEGSGLPGAGVAFEPPARPEVVAHGASAADVEAVLAAIDGR